MILANTCLIASFCASREPSFQPFMRGRFARSLAPCATLFLRTGFKRAWLTSNASNLIEPTELAGKSDGLWPPVPLLAPFPLLNLP